MAEWFGRVSICHVVLKGSKMTEKAKKKKKKKTHKEGHLTCLDLCISAAEKCADRSCGNLLGSCVFSLTTHKSPAQFVCQL